MNSQISQHSDKRRKFLIVLVGFRGAGKDSFADFMIDLGGKRGYSVNKIALSEPLKSVTHYLLGLFDSEKQEQLKRNECIKLRCGWSLRDSYINVGDALLNTFGEMFFAKILVDKLINEFQKHDVAIVSDMRRIHEWHYLYNHFIEIDNNLTTILINIQNENQSINELIKKFTEKNEVTETEHLKIIDEVVDSDLVKDCSSRFYFETIKAKNLEELSWCADGIVQLLKAIELTAGNVK